MIRDIWKYNTDQNLSMIEVNKSMIQQHNEALYDKYNSLADTTKLCYEKNFSEMEDCARKPERLVPLVEGLKHCVRMFWSETGLCDETKAMNRLIGGLYP